MMIKSCLGRQGFISRLTPAGLRNNQRILKEIVLAKRAADGVSIRHRQTNIQSDNSLPGPDRPATMLAQHGRPRRDRQPSLRGQLLHHVGTQRGGLRTGLENYAPYLSS
jgi:hypothetical protein